MKSHTKAAGQTVPLDSLVGLHKALNNLLSLWVANHDYDWNAVDESLKALAESDPSLPITMAFANKVEELRKQANVEMSCGSGE